MISNFKNKILFVLVVALFAYNSVQAQNKIAAFGSSVCNGTGDEIFRKGYIGLLKEFLLPRGWNVVSVSRGGDNTIKIQERWAKTVTPSSKPIADSLYLLPHNPNFVIIGLSLGNEGIRKETILEQNKIVKQYSSGIKGMIEQCKENGYKVIVANCYANNHFTSEQYNATLSMNEEINGWQVPSINLLGTIDDGYGKWVNGFFREELHPSSGGHREMFFSIVPTLFDALKQNKPIPKFLSVKNPKMFESKNDYAFSFSPEDTMHSFSISMNVGKTKDVDLITIKGLAASIRLTNYKYKEATLVDNSIHPTNVSVSANISAKQDSLFYNSVDSKKYFLGKVDNKVYRVTVSHQLAKGETIIFLNDAVAARIKERIIPTEFLFVRNGTVAVKDLFIHRSALNISEVKMLNQNKMVQASLEVYSLFDSSKKQSELTKNYAQSLSQIKFNSKEAIAR